VQTFFADSSSRTWVRVAKMFSSIRWWMSWNGFRPRFPARSLTTTGPLIEIVFSPDAGAPPPAAAASVGAGAASGFVAVAAVFSGGMRGGDRIGVVRRVWAWFLLP